MERPSLPDFVRPPITEVALSIQFEELSRFRVIHLGQLWEEFGKTDFPITEEQPPVPRTVENFRSSTPVEVPQIQFLNVPPMPRYLFLNESGTMIIQVQRDRISINWRKRLPNDVYPRFEVLLTNFRAYVGKFTDFLKCHKLGSIRITQAELTYVNRIGSLETPGRIDKVLAVFSGGYSDEFLHDPEEVQLTLRFPIRFEGNLIGRLYIDSRPVTSGDPNSELNMVLFARGRPAGHDFESAVAFLNIARHYIVSAFASVTSKQMHSTWERTDHA